MKPNERREALRILSTLLDHQQSLSHQFTQDTPSFTKVLCFGVARYYFRLSVIADALLKKRPKSTDVWICLLMGLYQLHELKLPDYAVVKETVDLLHHLKLSWAKGLVNAVLRTYCREKDMILDRLKTNLSFQYNHPDWFSTRLKTAWPHDWQHILAHNDTHPPMILRVNTQRHTLKAYSEKLQTAGIQHHVLPPEGLLLETPCDVHALPGFTEGDVSVQDSAAQKAAHLLDLKPTLRVLDACAAPGGKTGHLLELTPHLGACVALDLDARRLAKVQENLDRLQLSATLRQGDASLPNTWWDGQLFDRILLDAPCSATGVIRRHPDIKLLRTEADITTVVHTQYTLLKTLWPLLAPNGRLVYATCSIFPEENEQQLARFVEETSDARGIAITDLGGHPTPHGVQFFPGDDDGDGFFYGVLMKVSLI